MPDNKRNRGRHELGQNFLADRRVAADMVSILRHAPPLPLVELGAGDGALTRELLQLGRPVTAVEIELARVAGLRRSFPDAGLRVVHADALRFSPPREPHDIVSNVPFGITTPLLRRILGQPDWQTAVLLVQWEVARKRAAVGGTTMLTALWWPWFTFALDARVPASAFRPAPSVDGGVLVLRRRDAPLVAAGDRAGYQSMVSRVFTGRGLGLGQILRAELPAGAVTPWLRSARLGPGRLPRDLDAPQWVSLWNSSRKL